GVMAPTATCLWCLKRYEASRLGLIADTLMSIEAHGVRSRLCLAAQKSKEHRWYICVCVFVSLLFCVCVCVCVLGVWGEGWLCVCVCVCLGGGGGGGGCVSTASSTLLLLRFVL